MAVQYDPDLESLFREELTERASSLAEGAKAIIDGQVTIELAGRMVREGHTIKGTGRVMGHEVIARGGETCEVVWRWIQHGEIQPAVMLGRALSLLVEALPDALGGDPDGVSGAIEAIRTLINEPARLAELPEPMFAEPVEVKTYDVRLTIDDRSSPTGDEPPTSDGEPPTSDDRHPTPDDRHPTPDVPETIEIPISPAEIAASPPEDLGPAPEDSPVPEDSPLPDDSPDLEDRLVFEPGPDGKLGMPVVTIEIVRSAFAGGAGQAAATHRTQPDELAAAAQRTASDPMAVIDGDIDISFLDIEGSMLDGDAIPVYGLGGLASAVEAWAAEESVPVNAGRLYRMINDVAALRMDLQSLSTHAGHVLQTAEARSIPAAEGALEAIETVRRSSMDLEHRALGLTSLSMESTLATLPQVMKYLAKKCEKRVELIVTGEDTIVDRQMVDRVGEVVRQLMVNAVVHGIEPHEDRVRAGKSSKGTVSVGFKSDGQHVTIEVADDGAGIDWTAVRETALGLGLVEGDPSSEELRAALFSEGFSTNPQSSEFTGDGDGLFRISQIVEEVYGSLAMTSSSDGVTFTITIPAHRALQRAQLFEAGGRSWGLPEATVVGSVPIGEVEIEVSERGSTITFDDGRIPYSSFATVAGLDVEGMPAEVMIIQSPLGPIALAVDRTLDVREVVTKDLGPLLSGSTVVTGVALLGGDDTVLLVDAGRLASSLQDDEIRASGPVSTVLVVDDSQGVRQVVSGVLASHGFATLSAGSVADALSVLGESKIDALVVDFSMPRADGVALIHLVRQRYGSIPIVMLSGVASQEDKERAELAGADAIFDKSDFKKGALVEKLSKLIAEAVTVE
ncbi:MAG: response regulator [Acidimicrobiia bacterium]|nr:response regulator [Acidimicrobiia bacterium]